MKTVLVILTQANLSTLQVNESIAATMVLATFGTPIKVLLQDAALSLLKSEVTFEQIKHAFKPASNMIESFEFYDLSPILVESRFQDHAFVRDSQQEIEFIELDAKFIQSFNYVLYW
ncbi:hypothetical protein IAE19_07085 [Acinetobacter sp. S40]|uniref:hypothetical protein n=1 Tax=Acinetobacter sp. S40 TaxID=2767434 RepID=UPI00190A4006|nr:hypothetical protein [Acinetobacter sp. S40]MBJ9985209.1 hypothetical protein [Acinetobacter sp. S40]